MTTKNPNLPYSISWMMTLRKTPKTRPRRITRSKGVVGSPGKALAHGRAKCYPDKGSVKVGNDQFGSSESGLK